MTKGVMVPRTVLCSLCDTPFITHHSQARYCSPDCSRKGERKSWKAYADRNREQRRAYHQKLYESDPSKVIERTKAYRQTEAGKKAISVASQRQKQKSPEKIAARQAVNDAVRAGRLRKQPCQHCGANKVQAHHPDYSRPLDVIWLCDPCHKAVHRSPHAEAAE